MSPRRTSLLNWGRRLGVVLVVLLALGVAGEVLLRLDPGLGGPQSIIARQSTRDPGYYALDPELGALSAPSRRDVIEAVDYTYTFQTDHAGFPNPEPWPDRVDVAVLGNSLLDGPGVGQEGQFTTLLEQRLDGRKVLNLGIPGGGTLQQYLAYRRYAEPLHPKVVVAAVWTTWDINNSWHFAHWRREKSDPDYTHYRMTYSRTHPSGSSAQPSLFTRAWHFARRQLSKSVLLTEASRRATLLLGGQTMREEVTFPSGDTIYLSVRDQQRLAEGMERRDAPDIREIVFGPLEQLRTEVEAQGGHFLVVLVPSKEEIYGAKAFPAILGPIEEMRAGLQARGLPTLDLYPAFRDLGRERPPFWRADMHLDPLGNQIVADAIDRWIVDQNIFPASSPGASVAGAGAD